MAQEVCTEKLGLVLRESRKTGKHILNICLLQDAFSWLISVRLQLRKLELAITGFSHPPCFHHHTDMPIQGNGGCQVQQGRLGGPGCKSGEEKKVGVGLERSQQPLHGSHGLPTHQADEKANVGATTKVGAAKDHHTLITLQVNRQMC